MKTLTQFVMLVSILFLTSCSGRAQSGDIQLENNADRIEVIDFHTDHRCKTCLTIESLTKTILADRYAKEMENGRITFQLINVDEEENLSIAEKFGAYGTSLMLNVIRNGEEKQVDLTNFAFMNADNEEKFTRGFQEKLNAELKNLQL
jgi:major membrane immunogen (membrane-anchored lipoprotein)